MPNTGFDPGPQPANRRLESWKEIAAHFRRTVRTVQRWEREQSLPVHRLQHNKLPTIYAFTEELDEWWDRRRSMIEGAESTAPGAPFDSAEIPPLTDPPPDGDPAAAVADATVTTPTDREGRTGAWGRFSIVLLVAISLGVGALVASLANARIELNGGDQRSARLVSDGRQYVNQRTPAGFRAALKSFHLAVSLDPSNALAYSGLADTYSLMSAFGVMDKAVAVPLARAAAERSVELNPSLAAPHASLSMVLWESGERSRALAAAERAILLDPKHATARHWYALYLQDSGRSREAIEQAQIANRLDPMSPIIACDLSLLLRATGRADEARLMLERLVAAHPTFPQVYLELADVYSDLGRHAEAIESVNAALHYGDDRAAVIARLATLEAARGNRAAAVAAARRVQTLAKDGALVPPQYLLQALVAANLLDDAFEVLNLAIANHEPWVPAVATAPQFDRLRADPRWRDLSAVTPGRDR